MSQIALFDTTPTHITPPLPLVLHFDSRCPGIEELFVDGVTESDVCTFSCGATVYSKQKDSPWYLDQDKFWFWCNIVESGKSYMVGDIPTSQYLRRYSSPLNDWQQLAYKWALANPDKILYVETRTHRWRVFQRGEYVEFALPHQDYGGEKNYVTKDGKTKVLVNVD